MYESESKRLQDWSEQSWELAGEPERSNINIGWQHSSDNVKKIYNYTFYGEVQLATLKKPTKDGHLFLVGYHTGVTFGFKRWKDADTFARLRGDHIRAISRLMG